MVSRRDDLEAARKPVEDGVGRTTSNPKPQPHGNTQPMLNFLKLMETLHTN